MSALRRLGTTAARSRLPTQAAWSALPTEPARGGDAYRSSTPVSSTRLLSSSSSTGPSWWSKVAAKGGSAMQSVKNADGKTKAVIGVASGLCVLILGSAVLVTHHVEKRSEVVINKKVKKERKKRVEFQRIAVQGHNEFALKTDERYNGLESQFNELQLKCNLHHEKELSFWKQIDTALDSIKSQADTVEELLAKSGTNPMTECHYALHTKLAELKSEMETVEVLLPQSAAVDLSGKENYDASGSAPASSLKQKPLLADESNSQEVLPSKMIAGAQASKDGESPPGPKPPETTAESTSQEVVPVKQTGSCQTLKDEITPGPKPPQV